MTFAEYMAAVNVYLDRLCGMTADDLPDWKYHDDYEDDVSPLRCAKRAIKNAHECF